MALELSCQNDSAIQGALDEDDADIARLLKDILESDADKKVVLRLKGADAERFLSLMYSVCALSLVLFLISTAYTFLSGPRQAPF
jgi:hypothetical protein